MRRRVWAGALGALGALIAASTAWHLASLAPADYGRLHVVADLLFIGGSGVGLAYTAAWHWRSDLADRLYPALTGWTVLGGLLFASVSVVGLYAGSREVLVVEMARVVHVSTSVGLLSGAVVGTINALGVRNAREAARATARASAVERERERIEHLNDLLRHYVLNGVNVIQGQADTLEGVVPPEHRARLASIEDQSRSMATLAEQVSSVVGAAGERGPATETDLRTVLDSALAAARSRRQVAFAVDDCEATVYADALLEECLFLLVDAVADATGEDGTVAVDCATSGDRVRLTVRGEPAALPAAVDQSLFEPTESSVGLELYLASELIGEYGTLERVETPAGAVAFAVVLGTTGAARTPP